MPLKNKKKVKCNVCAYRCEMREGERGQCEGRVNQSGRIVAVRSTCREWVGSTK